MNTKTAFPLLGAAYYPEAWDEREQERDIARMQKAGITVARMAEFAWYKMEPREGEFDFEWLHAVIDKLDAAGIAVILGTPSATPPIWLEEKDPSMMVLHETGLRAQHGARRKNCSNHPLYRRYVARIVEKMAQEFGTDPRVIGWQIDNEIYPYDNGCFCEHCQKGFAQHLKKKYGSIEELNRQWNLHLFSQAYSDFSQVPMPMKHVWHGPHLRYEWKEYCSDTHVDFVKMQADILRCYTKAPIGTDMMPLFGLNYEKIADLSDVMQFNHYHDETQLSNAAFWFDYLRTFKEKPFWNTETSTCWNGADYTPSDLRPEGFCRANSWLPIVLGGGASMYWLWRQHWAGHELMHGSVLYASGRPLHIFSEVQEVASGFAKAADFLKNTCVQTDTAMIVSVKNNLLFECQPITSVEREQADRKLLMYRHITKCGIRPDIIAPTKELSGYKLLFTPYLMTLEEGDLPQRIEHWVKNGGTWVVGPMTDIRNFIGAHYTDRETGMLECLTGSTLVQQIPDHSHHISCAWKDGTPYSACHFLQLFDVDDGAESLVEVVGGFSALQGKTLVFRKRVGKGTVIVIGALPEDADAARLLEIALVDSGAETMHFTGDIVAAPRRGEGFNGIAAQEIAGTTGKLYFEGSMRDLLTDTVYTGEAPFAPFQTRILAK